MKVPTYGSSKVGIATAKTQAPRMPAITMPKVVPGAFGADVARATQALGEVGLKIAGHLLQMAQDKQDREVLRRETSFRKDWQNRLTNREEETVPINGQNVTRPKGFLVRQLEQAEGAMQEADETYQKMQSQYLEGLSQYQLDKLGPAMDSYYETVRNRINIHEANQYDESDRIATESNLAQKTLDASIIRDSEQLTSAIDDAIKAAEPYYRKFDEATRKILNEKIASNITEAAMISIVEISGNLKTAEELLESTKNKLSKATYEIIKDKLFKIAEKKTTETSIDAIRMPWKDLR